jgi:hypothetical protein
VLLGRCVPVFGVPRLLISFYRGRKWHCWKSLGGSPFYRQFLLFVCKLNPKRWIRGAQTPVDLVLFAPAPNIFSIIVSFLFLVYKMCIVSHVPIKKRQMTASRVTPWLWALSMKFSELQVFLRIEFEVEPRCLENLWTLILSHCVFLGAFAYARKAPVRWGALSLWNFYAAYNLRRAQIKFAPLRKPENIQLLLAAWWLSACTSSARTGRIFMKFGIWDFLWILAIRFGFG